MDQPLFVAGKPTPQGSVYASEDIAQLQKDFWDFSAAQMKACAQMGLMVYDAAEGVRANSVSRLGYFTQN